MNPPQRFVLIRLVAGSTPRQFRQVIKAAGLLSQPAWAPRIVATWLRNGREPLTNQDIAAQIAQRLPGSTIHVCDYGPIAHASGPDF